MKLEKGMLIAVQGIWYVLVEIKWDGYLWLPCICDHANNIHSWQIDDIEEYLTPKEVVELHWAWPERDFGILRQREIPYDVILEVLSGKHDERFNG